MNSPRGENTVVGYGRPSGALRFALYALVAVQKSLLCLVLLEAALETGFTPNEAAEHTQKLAEALGPNERTDDRRHVPKPPAFVHRLRTTGGATGTVHLAPTGSLDAPSARAAGPRAPPVC